MRRRTILWTGTAVLFLISQAASAGEIHDAFQASEEAEKLTSLLRADAFLEAGKLADTLLARRPEEPEVQALCGLAVLKMGRIAEAEAIFNDVVSRAPENPEAHLGLGRIGRIRNDTATAVKHLRLAVGSRTFVIEAFHEWWRTASDRGLMSELAEIYDLGRQRFEGEKKPLPGWLDNAWSQLEDFKGAQLYRMDGEARPVTIPLVHHGHDDNRMFRMRINGRAEYPFDIDSAAANFLMISPLAAKELGLKSTGKAFATGVGSGSAPQSFARLDRVDLGGWTFRDVPVLISDIVPFRGLKKGLIGTGLLKRFNVTIDVRAGRMDLYPLDRPDLMTARIDRSAVAADIPLYCFDQTVVPASIEGGPEGLYILDTAAATNLIDADFFKEHLKPRLDPARIIPSGIRGAQGAQNVNRVDGISIRLGDLVFDKQTVNEFSMRGLNAVTRRYAAGLLGNPLLWPYRVHMDFRNGRLILERFPDEK